MYPRLFENPNALYLEREGQGEAFDWTELKNIPFSCYNGKLYCGKNGESHREIANRHNDYGIARGEYSGRIFVNEKIITFWHFPEDKKTLLQVLEDIKDWITNIAPENWYDQQTKNINFSDPAWRVEIPTMDWEHFEQLKNYDEAQYNLMWKENWSPKKDDQEFIPISQYNGEYERSPEELKIQHLKKPIEGKKEVPKGYGSKSPKYQSKRQWDMATLGHESKKEDNFYPKLNEAIKHLAPRTEKEIEDFHKNAEKDIVQGYNYIKNKGFEITQGLRPYYYENSPKLFSYSFSFKFDPYTSFSYSYRYDTQETQLCMFQRNDNYTVATHLTFEDFKKMINKMIK